MSFFAEYPTLSSHAQIEGNVIAAGDMIVSKGHVKTISNQSGTWQPGGRNLAMTLKLLVRMRIVNEDAFVTGKVTVKQYMHRPDGYDVDAGVLVTIMGQALSGKLKA
jgi:hypothetical protein